MSSQAWSALLVPALLTHGDGNVGRFQFWAAYHHCDGWLECARFQVKVVVLVGSHHAVLVSLVVAPIAWAIADSAIAHGLTIGYQRVIRAAAARLVTERSSCFRAR